MKSRILTISFILIVLIAFGAFYFILQWDSFFAGTLFFDIIMTATAVYGVFALIFQNTRSKDLDEAQFVVSLNQEFIKNDNYQMLLDYLESNKALDNNLINIAAQYLDFFEPFYVLIQRQLINIDMIDELFCYRFFAVVNNETIQKKVLTPHKRYYGNICRLHFIWKKSRLSEKRKSIPLIDTDLSKLKWYNSCCNQLL